MRTMFVLKGAPACGKSTFASELIRKEPGRFVRFNRDDLRSMCSGPNNNPHHPFDRDREKFIHDMQNSMVREALRSGYDVILDNTHLVPSTLKKLHALAMSVGDVKLIEKAFNVPVEELIARDAKREGWRSVGEKIIRDMARGTGLDKGRVLSDKETYYPPRGLTGCVDIEDRIAYDPHSPLPKAVICDLDGTLSLLNGRNPYDATHCDDDLPNWPVIECVKALKERGVEILFTSGRMDQYREATERFIEKWLPPYSKPDDRKTWYHLFMRATDDQRKDNIIKRELFDAHVRGKFNVVFVLDDRDQVCDLWREMGLACFQVNYGNF